MRSLLAYDADGKVIATLDHMVARGPDGRVIGLVDFGAHEDGGGRLRNVWDVDGAIGSGTWPEWLGPHAYQFTVELEGQRIAALIHRGSGHRRERAEIEAAIATTEPDENGRRDIRHLVGGPGKPLILDDEGRTLAPTEAVVPDLPVMRNEPLAPEDPHR